MGVFEMSLINKMLQDLEERRSGTEELGALHGQVRAAPEALSREIPWLIILGASCAVGGAIFAGSWWMEEQQGEIAAMPAPKPIAQAPSLYLKLEHTPPVLTHPVDEATQNSSAQNAPVQNDVQSKAAEAPAANQAGPILAEQQIANAELPVPAPQKTPGPVQPARQVAQPGTEAPGPVSAPSPGMKSAPDPKSGRAAPVVSATSARAGLKMRESLDPRHEYAVDDAEPVAFKVSKQVKELTPHQRAENDYRRALALIEQGKSREAMSALEQALQTDARHGAARQTLAALLIDAKRPEEAIRTLSEGLSANRAQIGLAMMLARLQVDRQDLRAAIQTLQLSLPYAAERADYHAFLAALFQRDTRHKEAIEHYLAALKKSPDNGIWWMGIGISLQAENRIPEARDAFGRAKQSGALSPDLLAFVEQKLTQLR
jgi:MSHA biogenesis protein MshN